MHKCSFTSHYLVRQRCNKSDVYMFSDAASVYNAHFNLSCNYFIYFGKMCIKQKYSIKSHKPQQNVFLLGLQLYIYIVLLYIYTIYIYDLYMSILGI